jgi:hypothetical protein
VVDRVERGVDGVVVEVRAAAESVACPDCGTVSARVHGRYRRSLADTPLGGAPVVIRSFVSADNLVSNALVGGPFQPECETPGPAGWSRSRARMVDDADDGPFMRHVGKPTTRPLF